MKEMQTRVSGAKITSVFHSIKQYMLEGKLPCWSERKAVLRRALHDPSLGEGKRVAACMSGKNAGCSRVAWHVSQNGSLIHEHCLNVILYSESLVDREDLEREGSPQGEQQRGGGNVSYPRRSSVPAFASALCFLFSDQGSGGSHIPVGERKVFRNTHCCTCACERKFQFSGESKSQVLGKTTNRI